MKISDKKIEKLKDEYLTQELNIDKEELKALKKKLAKVEPRSKRGAETLFRLVSKNQYTLNTMIDRKANILISINALILSIILWEFKYDGAEGVCRENDCCERAVF